MQGELIGSFHSWGISHTQALPSLCSVVIEASGHHGTLDSPSLGLRGLFPPTVGGCPQEVIHRGLLLRQTDGCSAHVSLPLHQS